MTQPDTLASETLDIASSQVGVQESPLNSNRGTQVNRYLASVGLNPGYAWCMAFVYWCVNQGAKELKCPVPILRIVGVMNQWLHTPPANRTRIPQPGDIFIMSFQHGTGHTGFVEKVINGYVYTIEGNTNEDGSREGYMVARKKRPIAGMHGFIRLEPRSVATPSPISQSV